MNSSFDSMGGPVFTFLLFIVFVIGLLITAAFLQVVYFLLTLPLRRTERARLFLDLIETGLDRGRTPEAAIIETVACRDRSLGGAYNDLAAGLHRGLPFGAALAETQGLVSPQISGMLQAGARTGDLRKVLPACRQRLADSTSHVRGALNYLLLLGMLVAPASIAIPLVLNRKVIPQFRAVFEGLMAGASLPALTRFVFDQNGLFFVIQVSLLFLTWILLLAYIGGPRLRSWLGPAEARLADWIAFRLPWRRKRLQRDFSSILAVLLDSGVSEPDAVLIASEATANSTMIRRGRRMQQILREGGSLAEALQMADSARELQWRLANATRRQGGFLRALSGWHQALDAKAFQLEQTAAQLTTTVLVLAHGIIIGLVVIGMFVALINLLNSAALW